MTARRALRSALVGAVVLVSALGCGVRPEDSPRVLDSGDAVPQLPVPTVSQQPGPPSTCPPAPSSSPVPTPPAAPASGAVPPPSTTPRPEC